MLSVTTFLLAIIAFNNLLPVNAGIYVVNPAQGSTCHGGKPCTVTWLDDGTEPLLSAIGVCSVGLYTGNQQLVESISPVDVSSTHSLTFTPTPAAGPNSNSYYISFISQSAKQQQGAYTAFSSFFGLDGMSGSFNSPDASATTNIPIPSSIATTSGKTGGSSSVLSTITVGNHSTSTSAASSHHTSATTTSGSDQTSGSLTSSIPVPSVSPTTLSIPPNSQLNGTLVPSSTSLLSLSSSLTGTANSTSPTTNAAINGRVGASEIFSGVFGSILALVFLF